MEFNNLTPWLPLTYRPLAIQMAPQIHGSERAHCSVHASTGEHPGLGPRNNAGYGKDTSVRPAVQPDGGQKRKAGSSRSCMEVCETAINLQSGGSHRPSSSEREGRRRWELTGDCGAMLLLLLQLQRSRVQVAAEEKRSPGPRALDESKGD